MIDEKVLIERLLLESAGCNVYKLINPNIEDVKEFNAYKKCFEIVNKLAEEHGKDTNVPTNNGWIPCSERLPEEDKYVLCQCENGMFIGCIDSFDGEWRDDGHYRRKHMEAWQPLPAPYQKKDCNTCANNTDFDEVDNGCYMCCKGYENNYQPKGEQ